MAATRKATGNRSPARPAAWPVSAKIPAPIMTPVPSDTAPGRLRLPATSLCPPCSEVGMSLSCDGEWSIGIKVPVCCLCLAGSTASGLAYDGIAASGGDTTDPSA